MKQRITMRFIRACLRKAKEAGMDNCEKWQHLNKMKTIEEVLAYPWLAEAAYNYACDVLDDPDPHTWAKRCLKGEVDK